MLAGGGLLRADDLAAYQPRIYEEEPQTYRGYPYATAGDQVAYEALHILETCMVHAVFTDINMPVMTGYELLTEIARREAWKDILRIVISTDGSRLRQEEVRELNVNLYIRKPFRPEVVRDVLSRIASTHNR